MVFVYLILIFATSGKARLLLGNFAMQNQAAGGKTSDGGMGPPVTQTVKELVLSAMIALYKQYH